MKNFLINAILWVTRVTHKNKRYAAPHGKAFANLGCGLRCLPGWLNVDGSPTALFGSRKFSFINNILYKLAGASAFYSFQEYDEIIKKNHLLFYDLRNGVPFFDGSLDVIFSSHLLEHLTERDGLNFILDCYRTLKSDGILRILVPNLDFAMKMYSEGKVDEMLRSFFHTSRHYDFHMHKYNYNFETLKKRLHDAGFKDIQKESFQHGRCPNIDLLDMYPDHSLFVECRK